MSIDQKRVEELRELYTHYRDMSYGSGGFSLSWGRRASEVVLELLDELEKTAKYEYAIGWKHKPSRMKGRVGGWGNQGWGDMDEAETALEVQKVRDAENDVADDYEYKMLKRRLGGEIEDV